MPKIERTAEETKSRIRELELAGTDVFGVERSRLLDSLSWEDAQQYRMPGADWTEEGWRERRITITERAREMIADYLPHAWGKANARAAPSCQRSISHFSGLLWLMGPEHDELRERIQPDDEQREVMIQGEKVLDCRPRHEFGAKAALVAVSKLVGFNWRDHDDGEWYEDDRAEPVTAEAALASIDR